MYRSGRVLERGALEASRKTCSAVRLAPGRGARTRPGGGEIPKKHVNAGATCQVCGFILRRSGYRASNLKFYMGLQLLGAFGR